MDDADCDIPIPKQASAEYEKLWQRLANSGAQALLVPVCLDE
jgi:hypothetical protein